MRSVAGISNACDLSTVSRRFDFLSVARARAPNTTCRGGRAARGVLTNGIPTAAAYSGISRAKLVRVIIARRRAGLVNDAYAYVTVVLKNVRLQRRRERSRDGRRRRRRRLI